MSAAPIRTLVVDDSEFFAEMTAETLQEEHGIEATFKTSAEEALEWISDATVDCIVSNYEMPGMDGIDFLRTVQEQHADIPFIFLTGRDDEDVASRALEAGAADYLLKNGVVADDRYERLANRIRGVVDPQRPHQTHESLFQHSFDAIAHVRNSGEILSANSEMAALLDTESDELLGASLEEIFGGKTGGERLTAGREAVETGTPVQTEDSHDGRFFRNRFVPVAADSENDSFHILSRDVTARRDCERALERQNERLEEFSSVVSHDLRNPLNVAQSSLELLQEEPDADHDDRIDRSLDRMNRIIDDVLLFVRQDDTVDSPSPVDLSRMVRNAWSSVETGEIELVVETTRRIEADADQLREMLSHLLTNAHTHADASTVTVGHLSESGATGNFYVEDDGAGLPPTDPGDIFETGFSTGRGGTGLGLSIVRGIARAHGWTVTVHDTEQGGARFEFRGVTER